MSVRFVSRVAMLTVLVTSTLACSSRLTRSKAEELIRSKLPANERTVAFELSNRHFCFAQLPVNPCLPDAMPVEIRRLRDLGLLTVTTENPPPGPLSAGTSYLALTAAGQRYAEGAPIGDSEHQWIRVVVSQLDFGAITGIVESDASRSATVEFTVLRNTTPFGDNLVPYRYPIEVTPSDLATTTISKSAVLKKYDDGWRVSEWPFATP